MGKEKRATKRLIEQLRKADEELAKNEQQLAELKRQKAEFLANTMTEANVDLRDILTKDQLHAVIDILNRTNLDEIKQTKLLKDYFRSFGPELEAKGVLPDYLAYVVIYHADMIRAMAAMWN